MIEYWYRKAWMNITKLYIEYPYVDFFLARFLIVTQWVQFSSPIDSWFTYFVARTSKLSETWHIFHLSTLLMVFHSKSLDLMCCFQFPSYKSCFFIFFYKMTLLQERYSMWYLLLLKVFVLIKVYSFWINLVNLMFKS